jgi:YaaC-like Protein
MPRLPQPREGSALDVKGRPLTFSFFPVRRGNRRYGLNDVVFAVDPWAIIQGAVNDQVRAAHREESLAFVEQARAFFEAASGRTPASPLLSYYAFLNLGKALIRCRGFTDLWIGHGMGSPRVRRRPVST